VVPKHWRKAWRVTCPACGAPLSDTNERSNNRETLRDTSPLGTIFPEFDDLAWPVKRRINHAAVAAVPISFRPALLAGVSHVIFNPDTLNAVRDDTILRGRRAFERLCEIARLEAQATAQPTAGPRPFAPQGRQVCTSSARMSAVGE
jgi:hypothetical protein